MSQLRGLRSVVGVSLQGRATRRAPLAAPYRSSTAPLVQCHANLPHSDSTSTVPPGADQGQAPATADALADAATLVGTAWDPEGLYSKSTPLNFATGEQMGDLIARRERERAARRAATAVATPASAPSAHMPAPAAAPLSSAGPLLPPGARPLRPLPVGPDGATPPACGWRPSELPAQLVSEVDSMLRQDFMPVDLSWPGLRLLYLDPPVIVVEGFLPDTLCDQMVQQAESSGRMMASRIGASSVSASYGNTSSIRRTSTGMMITPGIAGPAMDAVVAELQARGKQLLRAGEGQAWGPQGRLPPSGHYCYEALQVARYDRGQHFLAHEDGFPPGIAAANGFQRHATLLVYLNDVPQGGATRFDHLGIAVQPRKGKLLLFFPAFSNGTSDVRSLHTAEDAIDVKYATQQWVARGLQQPADRKPAAKQQAEAVVAARKREADLEERERAGWQNKSGKTAAKAGKGFGGRLGK